MTKKETKMAPFNLSAALAAVDLRKVTPPSQERDVHEEIIGVLSGELGLKLWALIEQTADELAITEAQLHHEKSKHFLLHATGRATGACCKAYAATIEEMKVEMQPTKEKLCRLKGMLAIVIELELGIECDGVIGMRSGWEIVRMKPSPELMELEDLMSDSNPIMELLSVMAAAATQNDPKRQRVESDDLKGKSEGKSHAE